MSAASSHGDTLPQSMEGLTVAKESKLVLYRVSNSRQPPALKATEFPVASDYELNRLLEDGWSVVSHSMALDATGNCFVSLWAERSSSGDS